MEAESIFTIKILKLTTMSTTNILLDNDQVGRVPFSIGKHEGSYQVQMMNNSICQQSQAGSCICVIWLILCKWFSSNDPADALQRNN